jgi:thioredoxin reductase (NADPH)
MHAPEQYDLFIIGAGPAGLSCGIEAKRHGLRYCIVDRGGIVDNIQKFQRNMFFFSTPELLEIGDVPFIVPTTRPTSLDCVNYYRAVAERHGLHCEFYATITSVERRDDGFSIRSRSGIEYQSANTVVATGYYLTPNLLDLPGENLPHVSHFYNDPFPFFDQHVLVVGGKNSAVEAALDLYRHGAHVTVIHRGRALSEGVKYWILPDFENRVKEGSIKLHLNTVVKEFTPRETIVCRSTGEQTRVKTDFAFVLIGYRPDVPYLRSLGIDVDPDSLEPRFDSETMETNVPGLYVAGGLVGGRFNNKVFIENGREHGKKIIPHILSRKQNRNQ